MRLLNDLPSQSRFGVYYFTKDVSVSRPFTDLSSRDLVDGFGDFGYNDADTCTSCALTRAVGLLENGLNDMMSSNPQSSDESEKELRHVFFRNCSDVLKDTLHDHGLKVPLRRLIIIGHIKHSSGYTVEEEHQEFINNIQINIMEDAFRISGLLIVHENFFYHIIEASDFTLTDIIEETANLVARKTVIGAKVIHNSGIVERFFEDWNGCNVESPNYKEPNQKLEARKEESGVLDIAKMIKALEDAIFVLASFLRFVDPMDMKEKINELVPVGVLLFNTELVNLYTEKFFLTVEEHIEKYFKKRDYTSFLEQEWPPTGPIHDPKGYFDELKRFEEKVEESLRLEEEQKKMKTKPGTFWWTVKTGK
ncbi:uncharacterized protein TNCT_95761 [Trichonephila clavata]|uniref:Uncharacterized protein n=1 Tax=Trichonephila clavata TaxID=2740835 RepID=A0A8X6FK25_TRICU|nr:uncharacterized protein TNCT_95761 [Trichonephila clavata]